MHWEQADMQRLSSQEQMICATGQSSDLALSDSFCVKKHLYFVGEVNYLVLWVSRDLAIKRMTTNLRPLSNRVHVF